jgi:hypothetical protein
MDSSANIKLEIFLAFVFYSYKFITYVLAAWRRFVVVINRICRPQEQECM